MDPQWGTTVESTTISRAKARSLYEEFFGDNLREQAVLNRFRTVLPGHHRFFDVGCNIGQYAYFANKCLWNSEIICIEANSALLDLLKDTINRAALEDAHHNSFRIMNNVVSDTTQVLTFYIDENTTTSSIFFYETNSSGHGTPIPNSVNIMILDVLYVPGSRTLIKMDIEGAEYRALLSSRHFLDSGEYHIFD